MEISYLMDRMDELERQHNVLVQLVEMLALQNMLRSELAVLEERAAMQAKAH